jgi:exportin-5
MPVLRVDAHFTVVEAALKGYMKWRVAHGSKPQQDVNILQSHTQTKADLGQEQERIAMENNLEAWCESLLEMQFEVMACLVLTNFAETDQ